MALPGHLHRPVLVQDSRMASVPRINENLVIDTLDNAVNRENPEEGLMVHTDRGSQYTSSRFAGSSRIAGSSNRSPAKAALTTTPPWPWSRSSKP